MEGQYNSYKKMDNNGKNEKKAPNLEKIYLHNSSITPTLPPPLPPSFQSPPHLPLLIP